MLTGYKLMCDTAVDIEQMLVIHDVVGDEATIWCTSNNRLNHQHDK